MRRYSRALGWAAIMSTVTLYYSLSKDIGRNFAPQGFFPKNKAFIPICACEISLLVFFAKVFLELVSKVTSIFPFHRNLCWKRPKASSGSD